MVTDLLWPSGVERVVTTTQAAGGAPERSQPAARAARPSRNGLTTAFFDPRFSEASDDGLARLDGARAAGAGVVRIQVDWRNIATRKPATPSDPDDPAYAWNRADAAIEAAAERGLEVLLSFTGAPPWAEGSKRPRNITDGAWRPSAKAVGAFATAVARRYSESVDYLQVWNEPNLNTYLAPQWQRRGGRLVPFAPGRYRAMVNAAYPGVSAAGIGLVGAGAGPYGDPARGGRRIRPVTFWRMVFRKRTKLDVFAHHPYSVGGPRQRALSTKDVALPDVHRLVSIVRSASRRGRISPRGTKPIWVTEVSWDSNPPDPDGVPAATHARWVADSFFVLWKQGVDHVFWFQVRDAPAEPSFAATNQSGILLVDGGAKRARRAFVFPFSCERSGSRTRVWAKAPSRGRVRIVDSGGDTVRTLTPDRHRIVYATVAGRGTFKAFSGDVESISCRS